MDNFYFTFWIQKHGEDQFAKLIDLVSEQTTLPESIQSPDSNVSKEEYLFNYFRVIYYVAILDYFGIGTNKISFILDSLISPGVCEAYPPQKILETHKDVITIIQEYIKDDLNAYDTK